LHRNLVHLVVDDEMSSIHHWGSHEWKWIINSM